MKISASSFETAKDLCKRKWWLKEERDMPEGKLIKGADFGTALHGACEAYLRADDLGNGPEMWPKGWNAKLDSADTALVQLLVNAAIDQGILVRRPGRQPEEWMNTPIIVDDDVVQLTGKLDVVDPTGFEDHKSTGSKKWAKDEAGLSSDSAMLFYAVEWCRRHGEAAQVKMRYNYFLKDASHPETWPVEVRVTREVVEHFKQHELLPTVRAMVAVAKQELTDEQWEQVEGPKTQDACRAFGGCPYATICGRVEQPAQYRARVARILANRPSKESPVGIFANKSAPATPATPPPVAPPVVAPKPAPAAPVAQVMTTVAPPKGGIFAKKNSTPAATPAAPTTLTVNADTLVAGPKPQAGQVVQLAKPEKPAAPLAPVAGAAPWAHPGCRACLGTGMHPIKKRPCAGCRSTRMVQKLPTDDSYDISYGTDGTLHWALKGAEPVGDAAGSMPAIPAVVAPAQAPVPTVADPAATEKPKRAPRGKKATEVAADVAQVVTVPVMDAPTIEKVITRETSAPIAEQLAADPECAAQMAVLPLILLCSSGIEKAPAYYKTVSMADVFAEASRLVAEASGKPFFEIAAFPRRDALAGMAKDLAAHLKGHMIVCSRSTPDVDALVQALKPFAGIVINGHG